MHAVHEFVAAARRSAAALAHAMLAGARAANDRRLLMSLDDRTLRDLGLSRVDVGRL